MCLVYEEIRVEASVARVDRWESTQAPAPNWVFQEHSQTVFGDLRTDAWTQISNTRQHLPSARERYER